MIFKKGFLNFIIRDLKNIYYKKRNLKNTYLKMDFKKVTFKKWDKLGARNKNWTYDNKSESLMLASFVSLLLI